MRGKTIISTLCVAGSPLTIAAALAQNTPTPNSENSGVTDIVVTAQRRAENIQDVPISVQAFSSEQLQSSGVTSTLDLSVVVPGLVFSKGIGLTSPFLRGVGTTSNGPGIENPIALYVDGVYIASKGGAFTNLNSIERVEVLKGPQGTLFGRNATGGLIHIITKDPTQEPHANVRFGYGNYQTVTANAYVTGGLTNGIAADLALYYNDQNNGWGRNLLTGRKTNSENEFTARSKILLTPADGTRLTLTGDYGEYDSPQGASYRPIYGALPLFGPAFTGGAWDINGNIDPYFRTKAEGVSFKVEQELGAINFLSISSYRKIRYRLHLDSDVVPANFLGVVGDVREHNFSQELQLNGTSDRFKWNAGIYLFHAKGRQIGYVSGALLGATQLSVTDGQQRTRSLAGYAQGTYSLTDSTRATLGLRYTHEARRLTGFREITNAAGKTVLPQVPQSADFQKLTWRLALDQDLAPDVMAYVSYNRGFRSGGFNAGVLPATAPVKPEVLDAGEVGIKSQFLDRKLRLNVSAFYYDFKDIQLSSFVATVQFLRNAARARLYGVDVDYEVALSQRLRVSGALEYLHSEFKSFPGGPVATSNPTGGNSTSSTDLSGKEVPRTPKWSGSITAAYMQPIGDSSLDFSLTYSYNDGYFHEPDNKLREGSYSLVNGQIGWTNPGDTLTVSLWGKNLTNTRYSLNSTKQFVGDVVTLASPRTYGATIGFKF